MGFLKQWRADRKVSKAAKRASMLSTQDLHYWMETSLSQVSRKSRSSIPEVREEAVVDAETLYCVVSEIVKRSTAPLP